MAVFSYSAISADSKSRGGVIEADSPRAARRLLLARGVRPIGLTECSSDVVKRRRPLAAFRNHIIAKLHRELVLDVLENVCTLLSSGVTLESAWAAIGADISGRQSRRDVGQLVHAIHAAVSQGQPLSQALSVHRRYFDTIDIALVQAGEDAGELTVALERLVARRRLSKKLTATLVSAIAYPCFLMIFGFVVIVFLTTYVIPDITGLLVAGGGSVPLLTRMLQNFTSFVVFAFLPSLVCAVSALIFTLKRFPTTKLKLLATIFRIPILGANWNNWQLSQFCLVLRTLLASGVQLPRALLLAGSASGDGPVAIAASTLRDRILEGYELDSAVLHADIGFPTWLTRALMVGQETGDLVTVLERAGNRFEAAALRGAAKLGAILEPLMILMVGAFVGVVAYAALLPIIRLNGLW